MQSRGRTLLGWTVAWAVTTVVVATAWVRWDIAQRREAFATDARIAHRLLSQDATALAAVVRTLSAVDGPWSDEGLSRLPALHPAIVSVLQRAAGGGWQDVPALVSAQALAAAERASAAAAAPRVAGVDGALRRYVLVQAGADPGARAHAIVVAVDRLAGGDRGTWQSPSRTDIDLMVGDVRVPLQRSQVPDGLARGVTPGFVFEKRLDAPGQDFRLNVRQWTGPADWPWLALMLLAAGCAICAGGTAAWWHQRTARRRAEDRLRIDRVARLNTIGEAAAGLAHELNQPLTAALSNAQAARRYVDGWMSEGGTVGDVNDLGPSAQGHARDEPDERQLILESLDAAIGQVRRAADVVRRVRGQVTNGVEEAPRMLPLDEVVAATVGAVSAELARQEVRIEARLQPVRVIVDAGAIEQVVLNLLFNARDAVLPLPPQRRRIRVTLAHGVAGRARLEVVDEGPGLPPTVRERLFQPFVSTKPAGLGLGLSLCESVVTRLGGSIEVGDGQPVGTVFAVVLPAGSVSS